MVLRGIQIQRWGPVGRVFPTGRTLLSSTATIRLHSRMMSPDKPSAPGRLFLVNREVDLVLH